MSVFRFDSRSIKEKRISCIKKFNIIWNFFVVKTLPRINVGYKTRNKLWNVCVCKFVVYNLLFTPNNEDIYLHIFEDREESAYGVGKMYDKSTPNQKRCDKTCK